MKTDTLWRGVNKILVLLTLNILVGGCNSYSTNTSLTKEQTSSFSQKAEVFIVQDIDNSLTTIVYRRDGKLGCYVGWNYLGGGGGSGNLERENTSEQINIFQSWVNGYAVVCVHIDDTTLSSRATGIRLQYKDGHIAQDGITANGVFTYRTPYVWAPLSAISLYDDRSQEIFTYHATNK